MLPSRNSGTRFSFPLLSLKRHINHYLHVVFVVAAAGILGGSEKHCSVPAHVLCCKIYIYRMLACFLLSLTWKWLQWWVWVTGKGSWLFLKKQQHHHPFKQKFGRLEKNVPSLYYKINFSTRWHYLTPFIRSLNCPLLYITQDSFL